MLVIADGGTGLPEMTRYSNWQGPAGTMGSPRGTRGLEQDYDLFMRFNMERRGWAVVSRGQYLAMFVNYFTTAW